MDGIIDRLEIIRDDKSATSSSRPHIVIIGAGFGGLFAATQLARVAADVTVIDRRNHHLFQPLLYQVATAALSPADIAAPIRGPHDGRDRLAVVIPDLPAGRPADPPVKTCD